MRYVILLNNTGFSPADVRDILEEAREAAGSHGAIGDARIATRHIEFDVKADEKDKEQLLKSISSIAPLIECSDLSEKTVGKEAAIEKAKALFNQERFWECHEVLEGLWKMSWGDEKDTLNGLILVCAALVHWQKGEETTCFSVMERALQKLKASGSYHGIGMEGLRIELTRMAKEKKVRELRL